LKQADYHSATNTHFQEQHMGAHKTDFANRTGRRWLVTLSSSMAVLTAFSAQAQSMKPGLWEATTQMAGSAEMDKIMAQMQQQMAGMSAAQRKQMEEMMGKQGMVMPSSSPAGMSIKMCVTKEMVERKQMPMQQQGKCTYTSTSQGAGTTKTTFVCTEPPSSGEGLFTAQGDSAYTMKLTTASTGKDGPRNMTINSSGKWLSSDCGSVKPFVAPPQK
jgi:hypothetical protein